MPVAHPSLGLAALRSPRQLAQRVLLEFDYEYRPWLRWAEWLARQGWQDAKPKALLRFTQYDQTIHAAIAGQGIALGRVELIGAALGDGRLARVALPRPGPSSPNAYWLIPAAGRRRAEVGEVARWIRDEAAKVG